MAGVIVRQAFVTGASGYIGARLTAALARGGANVVASTLPGAESGIPQLRGVVPLGLRIDDRRALAEAARGSDVAFHLAGVLPGESAASMRAVNVDGTAHVARAAIAAGVPRLVFLSSTAVYRPSPHLWPLSEDAPLVEPPRSGPRGYGQSKVAAEDVLHAVEQTGRLGVTILRGSTVYGPGSRSLAWLSGALDMAVPPLGRGARLPTMQWLFVDDLVAALLEAARRPAVTGRTLNVVGGELASPLTLLVTARLALGAVPAPTRLPAGPLRFSYEAARQALGFNPTPLARGLRHSLPIR